MRNDLGTQYLSAMYWAFTTLTTVGYGDIVPVNNEERIFTVVMEFVGLTVFGMVIGTITQIAADFNVQKKLMNERTQEVDQYMRERGLSKGLQRRIRSFYEYYLERKSVFNNSEVLEVSSTLKHEPKWASCSPSSSRTSPSSRSATPPSSPSWRAARALFVLTGEYVCRKGVIGMEMYWLRKGRVVLIDPALVASESSQRKERARRPRRTSGCALTPTTRTPRPNPNPHPNPNPSPNPNPDQVRPPPARPCASSRRTSPRTHHGAPSAAAAPERTGDGARGRGSPELRRSG